MPIVGNYYNARIRDNQRQRLVQEYDSEPLSQYGHSIPQQQQHDRGYQQGLPPQQHSGDGYRQPPPQQYGGYSNAYVRSKFMGRRKALLIGINYFGQRGQLKGSINDVKEMSLLLFEKYEYKQEDTVILTDDLHNPMSQPTKRNILIAMHWLVKDARPNDALFFYYSGHGGHLLYGDITGHDEVIYPVDFRQVGHIVNDEMYRIMVTPLLAGVHLATTVDSCHPNSDGGSMELAARRCHSQAVTQHQGITHSQFSTETKSFGQNYIHPSRTPLGRVLFSPQQKPKALSNHVSSSYMPLLLPASAAAFAPRASSVNVILGSKAEPWLTQTLKRIARINRIKRPLNSVLQHQTYLTEILSSANAIWTLTSIMLPKAPASELRKNSNQLIEALSNFQLVHIEAYIVHVDMVHRNEVAFKLTTDSIEALTAYHKEIHCVDIANLAIEASTYNWLEKELQELHDEFMKAINELVYRADASALEGLEKEGVGELLCSKSKEAKSIIMNLFHSLFPLPPGPSKNGESYDLSLGQNQASDLPSLLSPSHTTTATAGETSQLRIALPPEPKNSVDLFKCELIRPSGKPCNAVFSRPYDLTRHRDTIHNARKQKTRCQFCTEEKTFNRKDALMRHISAVHPEIKAP
ncbi:hypothetical protein V494_02960 [Pseudogymnoascus sp. VKM F-4513 (FW-928)]|nr:hypothetical protein V494_02960 [Pseudogymnoascus sp. VKM F-4513 (FW-928)]